MRPRTKNLALLLAAGRGSRMQSPLPKPLVPVGGVAMIVRLVETLSGIENVDTAIVVGHRRDQVVSGINAAGFPVSFVEQPEARGTAHAVEMAGELIRSSQHCLVLVGDSPLLRRRTLQHLLAVHRSTEASCSFLTARFPMHRPYARVVRDPQGRFLRCVEERDATPDEMSIDEYFTSHYAFSSAGLPELLRRIEPHPLTGERYLTDAVNLLHGDGRRVEAVCIEDHRELMGLNTMDDVAWARTVLQAS